VVRKQPQKKPPAEEPEPELEEMESGAVSEGEEVEGEYTKDDVKSQLQALVRKIKKEGAKKILAEFGVEKLSQIQPDQYDEVYNRMYEVNNA